MRLTASASRAALIRLFLCLSLLVQSMLLAPAVAAGGGVGKAAPATGKVVGHQGVEAAGLPDLDEARNRPRHEPKAVPPVPSKRRRCPPRNPRCNDEVNGTPQATPTPGRNPHGSPRAADATPPAGGVGNLSILASTNAPPLSSIIGMVGGSLPLLDLSLLDFYTGDGGYSVSDSSPAGPLTHGARAAFLAASLQSSGLVGYWRFDEGSGNAAADSSGTGASGTLQNGASWNAGPASAAVGFDGVDDYVQVGANPALAVSTALSVSAWVYPTGAGSDPTMGGILVNREGEYEIARFPDGTIQWAFANQSPGWAWVNTGYVPPLNQWTHVAVTYDNGLAKTYANGQLVHTHQGAGAIGDYNSSQNDFRVGGRQNISQHFKGRLDEVRIYNRTLTGAEVGALAAPAATGLVGHWKFDEASGQTTAADWSGGGNTGTLQGGAAWGLGMVGGSVGLDGVDDQVQAGSHPSLAVSGALSVSAWVYPTGAGSHPYIGGIIVNKEGEYELGRFPDGTIQWAVANQSPGWAWVNSGYVAPLNRWTHVVFTYDGSGGKTYADGQLVHTATATGVIGDTLPAENDLRIGGRQTALSNFFKGRIDEVRVYNRALTAGEASSLYTAGAAYTGVPLAVPGSVEAELFDNGGEGTSYHDTSSGGTGFDLTQPAPYPPDPFRQPTDVDMNKGWGYSGGHTVIISAGEWLKYTVDVAADGAYTLDARVMYWNVSGGSFHVEVDGVNQTGALQIPGGSTWQTVSKAGVQLTAGRHVVRVVCDSNAPGDGYMGTLDYIRFVAAPSRAGTGLTGEYYNGDAFQTYKLTRSDAEVNFDWGTGSPAAGVNPDFFTVRWTGTVVPRYTETYTFYATTDDGVRLWIDGQMVINRWQDQAPDEAASTPVELVADRPHSIRMEYYEHWGGATAQLKWWSPSQAKEVVPQSRLYGCWKGADQFADAFIRAALNRNPYPTEFDDWTARLAGAQGEARLFAEAQALGAQVFNSSEYANRNRSDEDYVKDLYRAYLQREPDTGGLTHWRDVITPCGTNQQCREVKRAEVRSAFDQSFEFTEKLRNLCGTAYAAPANGGAGYDFTNARLDPVNRTGGGGTDPYSRNFNFSIPLVSLAGRAGLDLGLTLSYNSLVWTKDATGVTFDADQGFPSPGFRLGFPTVEPKFVNPRLQQEGQQTRYSYLLLTPAGERVELRQVDASNVYESADSSYLRLTEGGGLTLSSTDGTRLSFALMNGLYRCTQVMDRNGNYLSVAYYGDGRIDKVFDTLGRALTFKYDAFLNLSEIIQPWTREGETGVSPAPAPDETHRWATFGYADVTLQPSFSNLAVIGDQPGTVIPAVFQVGLADGSFYRFGYNQWGQVWKVTHYAADSLDPNGQTNESHPLSSTRLNLPGSDLSAPSAQADCPRFTENRTWVEYGVMNQSAEVATTYSAWSPAVSSCDVTTPDGTLYRELYGTSDWQKGLTTQSEVWLNGQRVKWTVLGWEHDGGVAALYPTNPRIKETAVNDDKGNHRLTHVNYTAAFGLPREVIEYKADGTTPLRRTEIDYRIDPVDDAAYLDLRLIGLVKERRVYGIDPANNTEKLYSKFDYRYDWGTLNGVSYLQQQGSPVQHDNTGYGQNFVVGRGNLTSVRRWDVTSPNTASLAVESTIGYNTDGSVIFRQDPSGHKETFGYQDKFWSPTGAPGEINRNTFAYPTLSTNPDGFTVSTEYFYSMGALRELQTPLPNEETANLPGPVRRTYYDAAGRPVQLLTVDTGAYTKWVYPKKMDVVQSFTLIEAGKESYTARVLDGAGRVRATASNLPFSGGGYSGQLFDYDVAGRLVRQSNPTATTAAGAWPATDDDAAGGWRYTQTTYDWKGRPLLVTAPKLNPNNPSEPLATREFLYGGCGCAGGEVVTTRDEVGRRLRVTYDVLGRSWKTEVLTQQPSKPQPFADGPNEAVYSTTTNTYDALDNVTQVITQAASSGVTQTTTTGYDGHGRVSSKKAPEATVATSYTYYNDDTLHTVTDGRNVTTTYEYNGRHQRRTINYTIPAGINPAFHVEPVMKNVELQYDAAGNRRWMKDGVGRVDYEYNTVSQLLHERRNFGAPLNRTYEMDYDYNKAGQLTHIFDSFDGSFDYARDAAGRLTDVTGSTYGGINSYLSNVRYRAGGGVKSASYSNNTSSSTIDYDARLRPWKYKLKNDVANTFLMREDFSYYLDSRLALLTDLDDTAGSSPPSTIRYLSRSYSYDLLGRVTGSMGASGGGNVPLNQSYDYDEFNNLTRRAGSYYNYNNGASGQTDTPTYTNNRRDGWAYDPDGRYTGNPASASNTARDVYYDAAGQQTKTVEYRPASGGVPASTVTVTFAYDGDGRVVYETSHNTAGAGFFTSSYTLRSAALGGEPLTTLNSSGDKSVTFVPAEGFVFARQSNIGGQFVSFTMRDPVGVTESNRGIFDPLGNFIPFQQANDPRPPAGSYSSDSMRGLSLSLSNPNSYGNACYLNGLPVNCTRAAQMVNNGLAQVDSLVSALPGIGGDVIPVPAPPDKTAPGPDDPVNPGSLNPKYLGGTTFGFVPVQFFVSPGAQPTTTTNPQQSGRVPLSGEALTNYIERRNNLVKLLKDKNSACYKYLRDTVGISGTRIARTVLAQRPFDGEASTITLEDAGILPRGGLLDTGSGYALPSTAQVRDLFSLRPPLAFAAQAAFARASTGATFHDVYYVPSTVIFESTILEEALHTFLGSEGTDEELERRKAESLDLQRAGCNTTGDPHVY